METETPIIIFIIQEICWTEGSVDLNLQNITIGIY